MSRISDLAAIANVVGSVLTKNAALRSAASQNKWKTSSVLRDVGIERTKTPSYDNFESAETSTAANEYKEAAETSPQHEEIRPEQEVIHEDISKDDPPLTDTLYTSATEQESAQDEPDIFVLRGTRRIPSVSSKPVSSKARNSFRADPDAFRPTQADRFNIRAKQDDHVWKPQAAVDTKLSDVEEQKVDVKPPEVEKSAEPSQASPEVEVEELAQEIRKDANLHSSAVPSSRLSRLYHYGTLGASLGFNAFTDSAKRILNGPSGSSTGILSSRNTDLLVRKLSRMRGAALKLGQMISFQDENLPGPIREVLQRVQDAADYMPEWQLERVMSSEFGAQWRDLYAEFGDVPIAAASIGQVHKAKLHDGRSVAVKVQYPGVANSISSDLSNLSLLLTASRLLPKGLYLDKTIENARTELAWECDYIREAENTRRFGELVSDSTTFKVPKVIDECSGKQVLTTEFMDGIGIAKSEKYSQELRDFLGTEIMRLCLREIAEFRFMQTDPNWTNFLYNNKTRKIELLDFGACRSFDREFIDKYCKLLVAAAYGDKPKLLDLSTQLGYLTGAESPTMIDAHISSILALSEPFSMSNKENSFDFAGQTVTDRVRSFIPVMLRERLAPPPEETYSLHRRLSGHFLLCARMRSRIPCKTIFTEVMTKAGYMS